MRYAFYHFLFFVLLFGVFRLATNQRIYPDAYRLGLIFDVEHYDNIRTDGYSFNPEKQSNVAFFPAFPYFWRWLGADTHGIAIVNLFLFYGGIFLWIKYFKPARNEILIYLSLPVMFFMYVPYSEPLFFFNSILILIGFRKNNIMLIVTGLALSSLTRSAGNVFLPALVLTELIATDRSWRKLAIFSGTTLLSIAFVSFIQYIQTGEWFGFMQTQKHWEHRLSFPHLPFHSWGKMLVLDAAALLVGTIIGVFCIYHLVQYFRNKITVSDKAYLFSIFCIAGLTLITIIFKKGALFSLNRYFIPTAFFAVAGSLLYRKFNYNARQIGWIMLGIFLFFASCHFFLHISFVLKFALLTLYMGLYVFAKHPNFRLRNYTFWALYLINCGLQVYLMDYFLHKSWVG